MAAEVLTLCHFVVSRFEYEVTDLSDTRIVNIHSNRTTSHSTLHRPIITSVHTFRCCSDAHSQVI